MGLVVSPETVSTLNTSARQVEETTENMDKAVAELRSCYDQNSKALGPHKNEMESIIEDLKKIQDDNKKVVIFTCNGLKAIAKKYNDILAKKLSSGTP